MRIGLSKRYVGGDGCRDEPLIPAGYDVAWSMITALVIALTVVALISLARSAKRLTTGHALLWALVVLVVPVLGPITWFGVGRRSATAEHSQ